MIILEAILHHIIKSQHTAGTDAVQVQKRQTRLPVDSRLERTVEDIVRIYTKSTSAYGTFDADEDLYRFPVLMREYVAAEVESAFITFTQTTTDLIAKEMASSSAATGGYALFLRYSHHGQNWALIAMLKLKSGTGVNEETLELSDTLSFDIEHLHEAARIDLGKWQVNTQPYLSFIKKRQGGEDITQYFRKALGCTEYTDAKHHTSQMQKAFDAFSDDIAWTADEKQKARQRVYDYCSAKDQAGEPVNLTALSAIINDQDPTAFSEYSRKNGFEVAETFKPHRASYSRLKRISRTFGSIKVGFDVSDILDGLVDIDENTGSLVISNPPVELLAEIKRHRATDDDDAN